MLTAFLAVPLVGMLALALDLGVAHLGRAQLQRASDAAAMAAAWELLESRSAGRLDGEERCRAAAREYAALNHVLSRPATVTDSDVLVGYRADPRDGDPLDVRAPERLNVVTVQVRRDAGRDGPLPLFFGRIFGRDHVDARAASTAGFLADFKGFHARQENAPLLPFALDLETWQRARNGHGPDDWTWDLAARRFVRGADGIPEINLFPQDTGSAGNRGTVNLGASNNSASRVARQILHGLTQDDMDYHGGVVQLDRHGELLLGGDPGISAGFKDELAAIIGEGRVVPVFREVAGRGNNAMYTIVRWAGVRICEVELRGSDKRVMIQGSPLRPSGAIPADRPMDASQNIYSRVWLTD